MPIMHTSNSFLFHFFIGKISKSVTILRVEKQSTRSEKEHLVHPHKPGQCIYIFSKCVDFFLGSVSFFFYVWCRRTAHLIYLYRVAMILSVISTLTKKWTLLSSFKLQLFAMLLFVYGWFKFLYDIHYTYYQTDILI